MDGRLLYSRLCCFFETHRSLEERGVKGELPWKEALKIVILRNQKRKKGPFDSQMNLMSKENIPSLSQPTHTPTYTTLPWRWFCWAAQWFLSSQLLSWISQWDQYGEVSPPGYMFQKWKTLADANPAGWGENQMEKLCCLIIQAALALCVGSLNFGREMCSPGWGNQASHDTTYYARRSPNPEPSFLQTTQSILSGSKKTPGPAIGLPLCHVSGGLSWC